VDDINIKEKILEATFLNRLNTGEFLITICIVKPTGIVSMFFPYVLNGDDLDEFCPYTKNRRFDMSAQCFQFVKAPSAELMDKFYTRILVDRFEEFSSFIEFFSTAYFAQIDPTDPVVLDQPEDAPLDRVLH